MIIYTDRASLSKWDARFIELAEYVAAWSKGPRKRIGAVIVRPVCRQDSKGRDCPRRRLLWACFPGLARVGGRSRTHFY